LSFALPPSHLGHSSKLDGSRFGVGSNKFDSALAAPSVFTVFLDCTAKPQAVCGFSKKWLCLHKQGLPETYRQMLARACSTNKGFVGFGSCNTGIYR
jgi:hypothetical protein